LYGPNRDIAFFIPVGSRPGSVRFARRRKDCRLSAETDMQEYFASVHLRFTRRCSRSNGQDSFGTSRGSPAVSKCSLMRNAGQSCF